jgi:uncharacterized protein YcfJ
MKSRFQPALLALPALCLVAGGARATEYGTVVSVTPVVAAVPVAQQQCADQPVYYQQPTTGAGALIGAIAGAAIGNTMGAGAGRAVATGIGFVAGSAIGNQVEAQGRPPVEGSQQRCSTVSRYENRTVGYDVVYDYQGVRRSTRLAQDPGERIALDVQVAPVGAAAPVAPPPPVAYEQAPPPPPRVVYASPYPYYSGPQVYVNPWPVFIFGGSYGGGYGGGGGWGGHRR